MASRKYSLELLINGIKKKGNNLSYDQLEMQHYLKSDNLNTNQAKLKFLIRARMIHCKSEFKNMYINRPNGLLCSQCLLEIETPEHAVIHCTKLKVKMTHKYEDLFSSDEALSTEALKDFENVWKLREVEIKENAQSKSIVIK